MSRPSIDPDNPMAKAMAASQAADLRRLRAAAEALHAVTPSHDVLFDREMCRKGHAPVRVLFRWPGVLMLLNPAGGEIIREAAAADMHADVPLAAAFMARQAKGRPLKAVTFQPPAGPAPARHLRRRWRGARACHQGRRAAGRTRTRPALGAACGLPFPFGKRPGPASQLTP